jgi:hypothetical protein
MVKCNTVVPFGTIIPSALIKVSYPLILPAPPYLLMSFYVHKLILHAV